MTGAVRAEIVDQDLIDTSNLYNSIADEPSGPNTQKVGTNVEYSVYLEYGTSRMSAKAFMRRTMDNTANQANVAKLAAAALAGGVR
jgi:HK97 gp10 family phage protein